NPVRKAVAGASEINTHAVALVLGVVGLFVPVASEGDDVKSHMVAIAKMVGITRGKVAVDTVSDVLAGGADADGLHDLHAAVPVYVDARVKRKNAFVRLALVLGRQRHRGRQHGQQQQESFHLSPGQAWGYAKTNTESKDSPKTQSSMTARVAIVSQNSRF